MASTFSSLKIELIGNGEQSIQAQLSRLPGFPQVDLLVKLRKQGLQMWKSLGYRVLVLS